MGAAAAGAADLRVCEADERVQQPPACKHDYKFSTMTCNQDGTMPCTVQ